MKKRWKLLLTLGLALVAVGVLMLGFTLAVTDPNNMVKTHKESWKVTTQECIKCHGDKRSEAAGTNTLIYSAHKSHSMNIYLRFNTLTPWDNDGDGVADEDPAGDKDADGIDNDFDGLTDEPGIEGMDDDGDTLTDEPPIGYLTTDVGWNFDDDEDGLVDEDPREAECAKCHQTTELSLGGVITNEIAKGAYPTHGYDGEYKRDYPRRWGGWEGTDQLNNATTASTVFRKQVDPALCVSCHGGFTTVASLSKQQLFPIPTGAHWRDENGDTIVDPWETAAAKDPRGCTRCHRRNGPATDPQAEHRYVTYVNTRYASTSISCLKCHGGYVFFDVPEMNYLTNFAPYWPQP